MNHCQHGFTKSVSTVTNLVTCLDFVTTLVHAQRQVDAIYFHLSSASDLVAHAPLLHKLTDRFASVTPEHFGVPSVVLKVLCLVHCYLIFIFWSEQYYQVFRYLLFAVIRIFRTIKFPYDCSLPQMDIRFTCLVHREPHEA